MLMLQQQEEDGQQQPKCSLYCSCDNITILTQNQRNNYDNKYTNNNNNNNIRTRTILTRVRRRRRNNVRRRCSSIEPIIIQTRQQCCSRSQRCCCNIISSSSSSSSITVYFRFIIIFIYSRMDSRIGGFLILLRVVFVLSLLVIITLEPNSTTILYCSSFRTMVVLPSSQQQQQQQRSLLLFVASNNRHPKHYRQRSSSIRNNNSNNNNNNRWGERQQQQQQQQRSSHRKYNTTTMLLLSQKQKHKQQSSPLSITTETIQSESRLLYYITNKNDDEIMEWIQSIVITTQSTTPTTIATSNISSNISSNSKVVLLLLQQQQSDQFWTIILQSCYRCTRPDLAWDVFQLMPQRLVESNTTTTTHNNNNKETTNTELLYNQPTRHHALIYIQTLLQSSSSIMNTTTNNNNNSITTDVSNLARAMDFVRYMAISNSVSSIDDEEEDEVMNQQANYNFNNNNNYYYYSTTFQRSSRKNILPDRIIKQSVDMKRKLKEKFSAVPLVPPPDPSFIKLLLRYCTTTTTTKAKDILELSRELIRDFQSGIVGMEYQNYITEQSYHLLFDSSICRIRPELAKDIIRDMRITRRYRYNVIPPSQKTYTKAISLCRHNRNLDLALFYLSNAQLTDGLVPDVYMYSAAIWTAAQVRNGDTALQLLHDMQQQQQQQNNCTPNIITYNGVIAALSSCGRIEEAIYTIYIPHIVNNPDITPTYTTFFHLATGIRNRKDTFEEKLAYLWRIYERMGRFERRVTVGGPILEELITSYGALGHYDEAKIIFDSITGPSNAVCLRAILFACSVADPPEWEAALELLHSSDIVVETSSSAPAHIDPGALCNAMLACSKANKWEESLQLLRLYGSSTNVSIVAINSLIAACGRGGRPDMAMEILNNEIYKYNLQPDLLTYRNAVIACNQAAHHERKMTAKLETVTPIETIGRTTDNDNNYGDDDDDDEDTYNSDGDLFEWWECAISLLYRMKESGIQPDTHTLSSAISACEAAGEWETALSVLQSIIESIDDNKSDDDPDVTALNLYCFNAAISACEKGGAWAEALDIYERMKEYGGNELRPSIVTLGSMILALDNGGQKDLAVTIYEEGVQQKIINPWRRTQNTTATGKSVKAMDLHKFSAAMARAAIRSYIENLLASQGSSSSSCCSSSSSNKISDDLIIITGKGLRSEDGRPIVMPTVRSVLKDEYDINATIGNLNTGRLIVSSKQLNELIQRRSWR